MTETRSADWLRSHALTLWQTHFSDVPPGFPLEVNWGIRARHRFGSIAARNGKALVRLNALFALPEVPEFVIEAVLAHEFAHYAHGFGSGLPQKYRFAHQGGVVEAELASRGLLAQDVRADEWLKTEWEAIYLKSCPDLTAKRTARLTHSTLAPPNGRTLPELEARFSNLAVHFASEPPVLDWLAATRRHTGMSYYFPKSSEVRLHPLLADPRVPDCCIDLELLYWLTRFEVGGNWPKITACLVVLGYQKTLDDALAYKRNRWTRLLKSV